MVTKFSVVVSSSYAADHSEFCASMFIPRNPLRFFHQQRAETLVLEFGRVE